MRIEFSLESGHFDMLRGQGTNINMDGGMCLEFGNLYFLFSVEFGIAVHSRNP